MEKRKTFHGRQVGKKRLLPIVFPLFLFLLIPLNGYGDDTPMPEVVQQNSTRITGVVKDAYGEPVIGANVKVVGTTQGTITDFEGKFSINVSGASAKIKISFIGYKDKEVTAKKGVSLNIVLEEDAQTLGEVQVVAYGVQKKVSITGAISSMKGDDLLKTPAGSLSNVLSGQITGISSVQYSGEPGADAADIYVRGVATWNNAKPLIQVDGVERDFSQIDPNEIESVTVLKDASATAVFGVHGCDDDKDFSYEGQLDLNLLNLTQAREVWDGAECNVTTDLRQSEDETPVKNFTYKLSLSLYQGRTAGQEAKVSLVVNKDTLNKVLAKVAEGGIYAKYDGAELLPESYYHLSSQTLTLQAGETKSDAVSVTVYSSELVAACQEAERNLLYVLPLAIEGSSSYGINSKTNTLMLLFNVTYVESAEDEKGPEYVPDPNDAPETTEEGLVLKFHDEFNGTGEPDWNVWRWEEGFQRNQELQWYQKENAICKDGALIITGKEERVKNTNYEAGSSDWKKNREYAEYTSSCLITKDYRFRKGRMLVRAKIPTAMGAWPAIWTTGGSTDSWCWEWPLGGEIDLLEYYLVNGKPSVHANVCWGSDTRWNGKWQSYNRPVAEFIAKDKDWGKKYHIWRMDWCLDEDENTLRLYLDDELMNEIKDLKATTGNGSGGLDDWWRGSYRNPYLDEGNNAGKENDEGFGQCIWLNLALGSNGGEPDLSKFPLEYHVDYVRVYQFE